jgi:hypothetical protein
MIALVGSCNCVQAAQPQCGPHQEAVDQLRDQFHETSKSQAITSAGTLLEVFRTEDGSTWTIVVTTPQGVSCIVANGENWQDANLVPADPGATRGGSLPDPPEPSAPQGYPGTYGNSRIDSKRQIDI